MKSFDRWLVSIVVAWFGFMAWPASATTVRVHYDVGWGHRIAIRGSQTPMTWTHGVDAQWTAGNVWVLSWPDNAGDMEFKPLIDDQRWSTGGNYAVKAGATVDVYPFFGPAKGSMQRFDQFYSPQLGNRRSLRVYLPPSYHENPLKRYPVLYMHDGQNLFDASTAFGGVEWGVDETVNRLVGSGAMAEVIVVGIDNTADRIAEYTPCCDPQYGGGRIDRYEQFVVDTVKPFVDYTLRTRPSAEDTALMGSSLGGLASFHIGRRRTDVFSRVGSMSGSFWWNNRQTVRQVVDEVIKPPLRVYLDAGTQSDGLQDTNALRDALLGDGYVLGDDLQHYIANGAGHNEAAWAARMEPPLKYFFPWRRGGN